MQRPLRVVIDTNVLISGLFGLQNSPSAQLLAAFRRQRLILVTSPAIVEEVALVLARDRIVQRTHMEAAEQEAFISELVDRSELTSGRQLTIPVSRDIKDDKVLACALEGQVDYLITGDEDLLALQAFAGITIATPGSF